MPLVILVPCTLENAQMQFVLHIVVMLLLTVLVPRLVFLVRCTLEVWRRTRKSAMSLRSRHTSMSMMVSIAGAFPLIEVFLLQVFLVPSALEPWRATRLSRRRS